MTKTRLTTCCLAALLVASVAMLGSPWLGSTASAAPISHEAQLTQDWFDQMDAYYAAHPELTGREEDEEEGGQGWEPYNRLKWFHQARLHEGELPPAGARVHAWEVAKQRRAALTPRATWFSLGPANFAGRMLSIEFDPTNANIVYGGAAGGGVWKSTDAGSTWTPMSDEIPSLAIGGIAVAPANTQIVVIGTGEATLNIDRVTGVGILRSTDGGSTWNPTSLSYSLTSNHGFHCLEANPSTGTMLAGATDGLWRSTDDGATWTQVRVGGNWYDVAFKPGDPQVVYTVRGDSATQAAVRKSTDDGVTWALAGTGQPDPITSGLGKAKIAISAAQPTWVYALWAQTNSPYNTVGVYRTTDDGVTWTARNTTTNIAGGQGWYNLSLTADPDNADVVIAGGVSLYRSTNGGTTFPTTGGGLVHVDHHVATYPPGLTNDLWVGSDGGLWRSTDDGASWPASSDRNNGLVTYQFYDICVNNNNATAYYVMGGTQDNGTDKWSGTSTWQNGLGADGMVCNINPNNGTTVFAEIQFGDHRKNTTSGIGGYTSINNGITGNGAWVAPVDERQSPANTLFTATTAGIFRTTDAGSNWSNVDTGGANSISVSWANGDIVWKSAGPRYSTDNGTTWQFASPYGFSTGAITRIYAHPTDANSVLATFGGYALVAHVAYSTDLGATWANVTGDLPPQPVNTIVINPAIPSQWFIGTDVGVWVSMNAGVNWVPFETGLPNAFVSDLEIQVQLQKLVAGTHGRGAWEIDIPQGALDADVAVAPSPKNLMLDTPFPNPVTDRTLLRFAAKSNARVTLGVYDVQGRLVTDLADFSNGDGIIRTTPWFATDVSSGVYFVVLKAGNDSISKKIVVAK